MFDLASEAPASVAPRIARWPQEPASVPIRAPHLRLVTEERRLPDVLSHRDPAFARQLYPSIARLVDTYYRAEVEGEEHLTDQASMVVSTHNGGLAMPELWCMIMTFWRRFGIETPAYGLMHKAAFSVPLLGQTLTRLGAIPANQDNGTIALREGFPLLVCPGGDEDTLKPYRKRHTIVFGRRKGFIKLAIRQQVPIIPVVSVGAHETMLVLNEGRRTARILGLEKYFRIKVVPITLSFPFGITPAGLFAIPVPSKVRLRVLPPIDLAEPVWAADREDRVHRCFNHVCHTMQRALDDLASRRRLPVLG
jgi:1-acyl-sn-glycerol-3-phosphate acyltransferase